jgi:hypothetical protein
MSEMDEAFRKDLEKLVNLMSHDEQQKRVALLEKRINARTLVQWIADKDFESGDMLQLKLGGDGDNGERLIELLDEALRAAGYLQE